VTHSTPGSIASKRPANVLNQPRHLALVILSSKYNAYIIRLLWTATSILLVRQWWGDRQHVVPSRGLENSDQPVPMQEQAYGKA
jgi:hypothetical protein